MHEKAGTSRQWYRRFQKMTMSLCSGPVTQELNASHRLAWLQVAKNGHALLAARALGQLAGGLPGSLTTPGCPEAARQLQALLTPPLAAMLASPDPSKLLQLLNSNIQSPEAGSCVYEVKICVGLTGSRVMCVILEARSWVGRLRFWPQAAKVVRPLAVQLVSPVLCSLRSSVARFIHPVLCRGRSSAVRLVWTAICSGIGLGLPG